MSDLFITTEDTNYKKLHDSLGSAKHNGLYYYAKIIEKYIIPNVETDRPWNTIGIKSCGGKDRMIIFVHNNIQPEKYAWVRRFDDVVIVSSQKKVAERMKLYGHSIYLPLSIKVSDLDQYKVKKKDQDMCYMGNPWAFKKNDIAKYVPARAHRFGDMPREELLPIIAHYKIVYATGLCALEARALGCEVRNCSSRVDDIDDMFPLVDVSDAVKMLQKALDKIDKR